MLITHALYVGMQCCVNGWVTEWIAAAAVFADTEFKLPIKPQSERLDPPDTDPH